VFHIFAALAEFERDLIRERTAAGLAAAWARGRTGGRPVAMTEPKIRLAREMYASRQYTVAAIASTLGVSRASIYRHLGDLRIASPRSDSTSLLRGRSRMNHPVLFSVVANSTSS